MFYLDENGSIVDVVIAMSFVNPLDKYPLSSSPMRPPSSARSVAVTTRQSRSPPTWTPRKANTATPVPSRLSQRHRSPPRPLSPVRRRVTRSQSREPEGSRRDVVADEPSAAHARGKGKEKARQGEIYTVIIIINTTYSCISLHSRFVSNRVP